VDVAFILAAFASGFVAARVGLPPLVGYLAAGFGLHVMGNGVTETIETVSDIGVLLLLFGIGLKLKLKTLARPEVWAGTSIHMAVTTAFIGALFLALGALGLPMAAGLTVSQAALVGFAFSFSSTVFAVKALENRNESYSLAGRVAIGILVMQDVFAVLFLTFSSGDLPSIWAIPVLIGVFLARPVFGWFLDNSGHGELVDLLGFSLAIGVGAGAFDLVGLKPDLGALIVGISLSGHPKAPEMAERLLGYKDVLLVGFFLSIGLGGTPTGPALGVALVAMLLVPLKTAGFLLLLSRFRLRARTSLHTSLTLANYSEFGLIVVAVGVDEGLLGPEWLGALAVAVAVSFALAAPANTARYRIYDRWSRRFTRLERDPLRPEDAVIDPGPASIMVFGMGRVGAGAYDQFKERCGDVIVGLDRRDETVAENVAAGRMVFRGDALDRDFWERVRFYSGLQLVVLAMNDHQANLEAALRVKLERPNVMLAATASRPDEVAQLEAMGVDVARNLYGEAGQGLADDASDLLGLP
jgi:glutathione-regulated potassium-efflux system ancillary protein KefC